MKRIVLLVIMSFILLVGCSAPTVVRPLPEPEIAIPNEVTISPPVEELVVEELVVEEVQYIPEEVKRPYEPWHPLPPPPTPKAHSYWQDVPTREELEAQEREMIESGKWGVRVTYSEFGSGTAFYFYEPNPDYFPGSYATEDEDAQASQRLKEQFVYECRRQSCAVLPNPTYAEVLAFLEEAEIGKLDGRLLPGYNGHNGCTLVSIEVKKRANERGIRCANLDVIGRNHALNAFETTDRGIVWFDGGTERTPCFDREDLFPLPWLDESPMPTSIIRPLDCVVYIW